MRVPLERRNVHVVSGGPSERSHWLFSCRRRGTPTEDLSYRCTSTYMRGKPSAKSSVIGVRAQLREYSKDTRRADDEHCLLLVWIGLEARLLLWFSAKANVCDGDEM